MVGLSELSEDLNWPNQRDAWLLRVPVCRIWR